MKKTARMTRYFPAAVETCRMTVGGRISTLWMAVASGSSSRLCAGVVRKGYETMSQLKAWYYCEYGMELIT